MYLFRYFFYTFPGSIPTESRLVTTQHYTTPAACHANKDMEIQSICRYLKVRLVIEQQTPATSRHLQRRLAT